MADREVTGVRRSSNGRVLALCHRGEEWSPRRSIDAIQDIESGAHRYFVQRRSRRVPVIVVVDRRAGKYLRTGPDRYGPNNLHALPECSPNAGAEPTLVPLRIRRDVATVSSGERARLRDAIVELRHRRYTGDTVDWWAKQDQIHQATHVHGGPQFLPWHRELVNRFEGLLQEIDPDVALHYWDWRTDPRAAPNGRGGVTNLFTPDFMGSSSGPAGPPFAHLARVERAVAAGGPDIDGDDHALRDDDWTSMRKELERVHDRAHAYIGGTLALPHSAFEDPFVFLLHSNLDRLWASWQLRARGDARAALSRTDPAQVYGTEGELDWVEETTPGGGVTRHPGLTQALQPWAGGGRPPVAPWQPPPDGTPEVKTSRDPTVVRPPLYDRYVWPLGCSWAALLLGRRLPDGDVIRTTITAGAVDPLTVQFVLQAAPGITWWKGLRVPDGDGNSWMLQTQDDVRSASIFILAAQLGNDLELVFHKAKFAGAHRIVYRLRDIARIPAGSRVTFRWLSD